MTPHRKRIAAVAALAAILLIALAAAWPYISTAVFLLDMSGAQPGLRRFLPVARYTVTTRDLGVPTRYGDVTARIYQSTAPHPRSVAVFPGVHGGGVDEPRLVLFCGRLAATGVSVLCVPLPELREFQVTSRSTDVIEDVTRWLSDQPALAPDHRVGLVGVSFGGGLAMVAAGRPALRDRLRLVVSVGGYGDLPRTLHFLCTGRLPDGRVLRPHDYGLAVVALDVVGSLVPPAEQPALAHAVRTFLEASLDDTPEQVQATALLADARRQLAALDEPAKSIFQSVLARDVGRLGGRLDPLIDQLASDPALSPERSSPPTAPVFLLHASDDNVIPPTETPLLAAHLARAGTPVRWLVTTALAHAGVHQSVAVSELWKLVRFWKDVRDELD
jgi:acetyl esterase/lipase